MASDVSADGRTRQLSYPASSPFFRKLQGLLLEEASLYSKAGFMCALD
jgi:hypothetical protein